MSKQITRSNFKTKKDHRKAAKAYANSDLHHWVRRIVKSMKGNPRAEEFLLKTNKPI